MTTINKLPDYIVDSRKRFENDTAEHEMTILHDDGLYRHLRCQMEGPTFYYFDVITWPGYLTITGDCGTYVFSRIRDMFEFFEDYAWGINPHYWSEKLQAPRGSEGARSYTKEALRSRLHDWAKDEANYGEVEMYPSLLTTAVDRVVDGKDPDFGYYEPYYEQGGRELLSALEDEGVVHETWDWEMRDFDFQFLWCCWAIVWAIRQWREQEKQTNRGEK